MEEYTKVEDTDNMSMVEGQQPEQQQCEQQKGFQLFYVFPLLYVISVYLFPVFVLLGNEGTVEFYMKYPPFLVFGVVNIIVSVKFCKAQNRIMMLNAAVLVKYAMIPFFIVGGVVLTASFLLSFIPVPFMIFVGPIITALGVVEGWLILAFEAPYAIAYLRLSSKVKIRSKAMSVFHGFLQFFFTIDVIDVMILTLREHKWKKLTISIIILLVVMVVLLLLLVVLGILNSLTQ